MLDALLTRVQLAKQLRRSTRTMRRLELQGLPVIVLGRDRLYDPAKSLAWILSHERTPEPVRRGRPTRAA